MSPTPTVPDSQHEPRLQPQNAGKAPMFGALVALFKNLKEAKNRDLGRKLLAKFMKTFREKTGNDLYPLLRLLLPHKDKERPVYGLKEQNLVNVFGKALGLDSKHPSIVRLANWTTPVNGETSAGNFPQVLYEVLKERSSVVEDQLDIFQVNEILDSLAKVHGGRNSLDEQAKIIRRLLNETTPEEQLWLTRIILKDLDISLAESAVLAAFHEDAKDLYNVCSDLKKVAHDLWDPNQRLISKDKEIQLFNAFLPMLCKRPTKTLGETVRLMDGEEFFIDEKLDGERMQLHKQGKEYKYYSRNGNDLTGLYGRTANEGSLTPFIDSGFDPRVEDIVLDGEMLAWDPSTKSVLPFGSLRGAAKGVSRGPKSPRPIFVAFDLLHLNGQSLLEKPLQVRRKNMKHCVKAIPGRIQYVPESTGKSVQDVRKELDRIMEKGGEGLVIKHARSLYRLNERNSCWIKVKPEYMGGMGENMDLIVVGGTFGSGSRGGGVSTLICAAFENRIKGTVPKYITFASAGSGLTMADLAWIRKKPWQKCDPKNPPKFLKTANKKKAGDKYDVYLDPVDSFIVEVKAAEIIDSQEYGMGCTLRFPRIKAIRHDLSISDCMRVEDILSIRNDNGKRTRSHKAEIEPPRKKAKATTTVKKPTVSSAYRGPDLSKIAVSSKLFSGLTFVVVTNPRFGEDEQDAEKKELSILIRANGGALKQVVKAQAGVKQFVVYGGTITPYDLKLVINKDLYDVLKPEWVKDSVARGKLVPFYQRYFYHATERSKRADEYTATEPATETDEGSATAVGSTDDAGSETEPESDEEAEVPAAATTLKQEERPFHDWLQPEKGDGHEENVDCKEVPEDGDTDTEEFDVENWFGIGNDESHESPMPASASVPAAESTDQAIAKAKDTTSGVPNGLFNNFCFYFDTHENARSAGICVDSNVKKHSSVIRDSFTELRVLVEENGGMVTDKLNNPKLTHVLVHKRDDSRKGELGKRTSKPNARPIVIHQWVEACVAEELVLDADEFAA